MKPLPGTRGLVAVLFGLRLGIGVFAFVLSRNTACFDRRDAAGHSDRNPLDRPAGGRQHGLHDTPAVIGPGRGLTLETRRGGPARSILKFGDDRRPRIVNGDSRRRPSAELAAPAENGPEYSLGDLGGDIVRVVLGTMTDIGET